MALQRGNYAVLARSNIAFLAASVFACAGLFAQVQAGPGPQIEQPPALNPDSFYGKEPTEGVYVRDSAGAVEKLALAQKMERLKEWNKSADLYQEVIVKYADRVVPSQLDKDKKIYQYTSITNRIQEQLSHWPQTGLDVYRARFEAPAQSLLDGAGPEDVVTLNKVYALYFVTEAGKQAGIRLIDLYLENGEYSAAAWLGDRLLSLHPSLLAERSAILYRTALAYDFSGDQQKAKDRLADLRAKFPNDRGIIRGKEVILADSLSHEIEAPVAGSQNGSPDSWPVAWGDASRGRISTAEGRPGARLYGITLSKPNYGNVNQQSKDALEKAYEESVQEGFTLGIMPVVDRGELFFQDGLKVYGLSLESGVALPGWLQTYPNGIFTLPNASGSSRAHQLTVALTDHEALAIMGQIDQQAAQIPGLQQPTEPKMVCLDRQTGHEKWVVALSQLPDSAKDVRTLQMSGSPLVVGDAVLVIGRGAKTQFEDCYVIAFDLATGKHRWSTYIASASSGAFMWGVPQYQGESVSHLAYANGRVYVQTNLGALAALDAYTGAVAWLDIYPTGRSGNNQQQFNPFQQAGQNPQPRNKPWTFNPVMVQDGVVFSLPTEGKHLLIYEAGSGVEIKRIDLKDIGQKIPQLTDIDTLVGVVGDKLLLAAEKGMILLNWKTYTVDGFNPDRRDNIIVWFEPVPKPIRGRGFIVRDSVYVPCEDRLYRVSLTSGKAIEEYPKRPPSGVGGEWEAPEESGNILATSDHVIIAGAHMVNVYTDLALAKAKLDRELAATPNDPQPRLRYAEVTFVAGDFDSALVKLDEAIELLGGAKSIAPGANRDRVFNDALTFAEKLSKSVSDDDRDRALKLFGRAAAAADSPVQQVRYRLARAKFEEIKKDYVAAVKLYQEILADRHLRPVPMQGEAAGGPLQADAEAESRIAAILKDRPATYESFEQAAAAALEAAKADKENPAEKLLEIARMYPNSTIAGKALIAAADAYESAGDARHAIRVLRDMWFKYPQSPDKARILESVARNYVALAGVPRASASDLGPRDNMEAAAAALARAAALPGEPKLERPLKLRDGTTIDAGTLISSALETVRKYRVAEASRTLPDLGIPVPAPKPLGVVRQQRPKAFLAENKARDIIPGVKALVLSPHDFSRSDRVVTFGIDGSLTIFAAGQTKPLSTTHAINEEPASCAWVGDQVIVWGGSQVASVKSTTGESAWKLDLREMAPIEVVSMGDVAQTVPEPNAFNPNAVQRIRPGNFRGNGRVLFRPGLREPQLAVAAPAPAPKAVPGVEEIVDVRPVGDHVLLTTTSGRILSAELANGHVAWQTRLSDRPVDRLVANEDFAVVRVSDDATVRIAAFDTATGQMRCTKNWAIQNGMAPLNLALAADGTLVYTLPDRLCLKDLYKPWPDPTDKEVQAAGGAQMFQRSTQPDQLLIAEGRILALADDEARSERYVRIHSLETGQPVRLRYHSTNGEQEIDRILVAGKSEKIMMRVVGSHLYLASPGHLYSYNLDRPEESWRKEPEKDSSYPAPLPLTAMRDVTVSRNFLSIIEAGADDPQAPLEAPAGQVNPNVPPVPLPKPPEPGSAAPSENEATYSIYLVRLAPVSKENSAESGVLDYDVKITDNAGITPEWQAIEGGLCYLTADNNLHILRGSLTGK